MALTTDEQRLVTWAKSQLPSWFSHGEREEEYLGLLAKQHGQALSLAQNWLGQTLILEAVGPTGGDADWLNFHAEERNTRRQESESNEALRQRIRAVEDAVTRPILLAAVQSILDEEGIVGSPFMVELRRDQAYFGSYQAQGASDGGTFADEGGGIFSFTPTTKFQTPVMGWPSSTHHGPPQLVISGASSASNDGTFPVLSVSGDGVTFANAGAALIDATATWSLQKRNAEGYVWDGRSRAFMGRGYRMHSTPRTSFLILLPLGCTSATRASVLEMLRQKKGAGVGALVECRVTP